ncbi:MAG: hypothetical protein KKF77_03185 [Proteobacteria bacterium]|nr:hypothetical protein [Pseudomonadota bacterium]
MDINTLSTTMVNQAVAAVGAQTIPQAQPANADASAKAGGDSVNLSDEARAKAANTPVASSSNSESSSAAQSTADTLARRIAKLQKQLQQEQGSRQDAEDKTSKMTNLRAQIRQLQNQQKGSSGDAATSFKIHHV